MDLITSEPISPEVIIGRVRIDEYGAIITFVGTVRNMTRGKRVALLQIEPRGEKAESKLREMVSEVNQKWQLHDIAICHRVGNLKVGEVAAVVVVAAPHRQEAFQACQYVVDRLKEGEITTETEIYETEEPL